MPIGVSDKKTYFSHLLVYIVDSLSFLKDILCCSQTGMNKRQWPGLMSMTPYSLNQYSKPRWKMKGREKKSKREAFSSSFFFESTKGSVCSQTLWQTLIWATPSPPPPFPPQPTETDLTIWSNIQLQVRCFIHHLLCFCHHFNFPLFTEAWDIRRF